MQHFITIKITNSKCAIHSICVFTHFCGQVRKCWGSCCLFRETHKSAMPQRNKELLAIVLGKTWFLKQLWPICVFTSTALLCCIGRNVGSFWEALPKGRLDNLSSTHLGHMFIAANLLLKPCSIKYIILYTDTCSCKELVKCFSNPYHVLRGVLRYSQHGCMTAINNTLPEILYYNSTESFLNPAFCDTDTFIVFL